MESSKLIPVSKNESLENCADLITSDEACLGVLDKEGKMFGFVKKNTVLKALKLGIGYMPVSLLTSLTDSKDLSCNMQTGINLRANYEQYMPDNIKQALALFSDAADMANINIYLVGGIVRDIILNIKNFDIDITVEGNAVEFAEMLEREYPETCSVIEKHEDFKTAKIVFNSGVFNLNGIEAAFDFASTRSEMYKTPASLPVVEQIGCSICEDVSRRDFTINSMALSLRKNHLYDLTDPLGGYDDLKNKIIRILHPLSFIDDPTRVIRALKFSCRFGYTPDNSTRYLMDECIKSGLFNGICGERIKSEIKQTFNLNRVECFNDFISQDLYTLIDEDISNGLNLIPAGNKILETVNKYLHYIHNKDFIWLIYLSCLLAVLPAAKIEQIAQKLNMSGKEKLVLTGTKEILDNQDILTGAKDNFEIYEVLRKVPFESILAGLACINNPTAVKNIENYINNLKDIKISVSGKDLAALGVKQGVEYGNILKAVLKAKINLEITTHEEEIELLRRLARQLKET